MFALLKIILNFFFGTPVVPLALLMLGFSGAGHGRRKGGGRGTKKPLLPKICQTYLTMRKLATVICCLKKIHKIYKLRVTPLSSLFQWKSAIFIVSRKTDIDCILAHNF